MMSHANTYPLTGASTVAINARWAERLLLVIALIVTDMAMVSLGFWLAYFIRFELTMLPWLYQPIASPIDFYQSLVFLLTPAWVILFRMFGLYNFKNLFSGMREYARVFNACTLGMMLVILLVFFNDTSSNVARGWVLLSWLFVAMSVEVGRFVLRRGVQQLRLRGRFVTTVLIVGANEEGKAIAEQLRYNRKAGIMIVGFVDDHLKMGSELLPGMSVLGSVDSVATLVKQYGIQEIIIPSTALPRQKLLTLFQSFGAKDDINIRMSSGLYELLTTSVEVQEIGNVPLLSLNKVRLTGSDLILKRTLDIVVSGLGLLAALPLLLIIAIAIKLDSSGPIFYLRRVVGVSGKPFNALKLRTMYIDGDERLAQQPELLYELQEHFKLKNDPRITRVGAFLRKTSLDELPQLVNVLLGQMSLVGPRMITEAELGRYGKWSMNLSTVKPGITGLWQVSGRSDIGYEDRVLLDMHYIRNYSIWFDLYLLWQTVPAVLMKRGAY